MHAQAADAPVASGDDLPHAPFPPVRSAQSNQSKILKLARRKILKGEERSFARLAGMVSGTPPNIINHELPPEDYPC